MDVISKNPHWLLPEEACPCDIFLHFRGKYALAISSGQVVSFKVLENMAKANCTRIYIRTQDERAWLAWTEKRHPKANQAEDQAKKKEDEHTQKRLYGNKRAELISYVQKSLNKKAEGDNSLNQAIIDSQKLMQKVVNLPTLDWYFQKFHDPADLFHHCGRVSYGLVLFLKLYNIGTEEEIEVACFSALIHELEGTPKENLKTVVSQQTLDHLEKKGHPVPKEVIEQIQLHDELCSGKGFPNNKKLNQIPMVVRAFTLFNHFDSLRLTNAGTRRSRFERTKEIMEARKEDYDPTLWPLFWMFWENYMEIIT